MALLILDYKILKKTLSTGRIKYESMSLVSCECEFHEGPREREIRKCNSQKGYGIKMCKKCQSKYFNNGIFKGYKEIGIVYWNCLIRSAKDRNIEFNLDIEKCYNLFLQQNRKCALSDMEIYFRKSKKLGTASLDRIDSSKGYI